MTIIKIFMSKLNYNFIFLSHFNYLFFMIMNLKIGYKYLYAINVIY